MFIEASVRTLVVHALELFAKESFIFPVVLVMRGRNNVLKCLVFVRPAVEKPPGVQCEMN